MKIIYLGDSTLATIADTDKDRRSIPEMLAAELGNTAIGTIDHPAYNLDVYSKYVEYISKLENQPDIIIIPINLRSFSQQWDKEPGWQFPKEKTYLRGKYISWLYRPLKIFKYDKYAVTKNTFENSPVYKGDQYIATVKEFLNTGEDPEKNMFNMIIYYYMANIDPEHRKLKSLRKILKIVKNEDLELLFYFTPIDHESCFEYHGQEFNEIIQNNIKLINDIVSSYDHPLPVNMTFDLSKQSFDWKKNIYPNEHLTETGRKYVAEKLGHFLNKFNFND